MVKHTEAMIQKSIIDLLTWKEKTEDIYWFRAGSGAMKLESGRYFKTGRPGVPDICCLKEKFYGLEIKTATGRQSQNQKQAEADIKAAGGLYFIVRSVSDVKEIFGWS